jgi:hypothetical protein
MSENSKRDARVPEFKCTAGRSVCPLFVEMHCRIIDLDNENKRLREEVRTLTHRLAVYEGERCPDCTDGQQFVGGDLVVCPTCEGSAFVPAKRILRGVDKP